MRTYKPKDFGALIGRTTNTLQRWDREGRLKTHRIPTNRRYYTHDQYLEYIGQKADENKLRVVYYRVSSSEQKNDLESQREALEQFCIAAGKPVDQWLKDIGSGLNYQRKNFTALLDMVERGEVSEIVIAHKDRLVRFGYEWFERFCDNHGTQITVMNIESLSPEEEVTKDLLSIIHGFSSRLDGLRRNKKKITELVKADADHQADQPQAQ